jgi:N-acetylmuramoyl-L-alanine amidase
VRLYRIGDEGEPVRDIQHRLTALGFATAPDPAGIYAIGTSDAVVRFQSRNGLPADGIVGPDTWRALVGAGYRLGDRLLYHRVPMMRGDDVADLQAKLDSLGFETGKPDGIFGSATLSGLLDFQANRRLPEDGIAGSEVAAELDRMARATDKPGRDRVRERQWLEQLPATLIGQRIYVDPFSRSPEEATDAWNAARTFAIITQDLGAHPLLSRSIDTDPASRVRAVRANRLGVDFILGFSLPDSAPSGVFYFESAHSHSAAGIRLASATASRLSVPIAGRSVPILKDTRSPAVVIAVDPLDDRTGGAAAQGVLDLFALQNQPDPPSRELHGT